MKTNRITVLAMAASLMVMTGYAQTAAEQMQKGIYRQETADDLDGAISIYRHQADTSVLAESPRATRTCFLKHCPEARPVIAIAPITRYPAHR